MSILSPAHSLLSLSLSYISLSLTYLCLSLYTLATQIYGVSSDTAIFRAANMLNIWRCRCRPPIIGTASHCCDRRWGPNVIVCMCPLGKSNDDQRADSRVTFTGRLIGGGHPRHYRGEVRPRKRRRSFREDSSLWPWVPW